MGQNSNLKMKSDSVTTDLMSSELKEFTLAAKNLTKHSINLLSLGVGTSFLKWVSSFAAIYLFILDRAKWRTNIHTSLLIPYIFLTLPSVLFNPLRGEVGKWFALIAVVLRLFFPGQFPDWLEMPAALILLVVVAPNLLACTIRNDWIGSVICLVIACYLLQQHIRASGGFRNAFTKAHGGSKTVAILLLFVYPIWALNLANHSVKLLSLGFDTSFVQWVASFAAIYLFILDRTNWRTNILTALLIPYIFLTLPSMIFNLLRGEVGKWIALIAVVLRLFFPRQFPDWLEMPAAFILLVVVAPNLLACTIRNDWIGSVICLVIACYLLQQHIRASGGFRNAFTKAHGGSSTVAIVILFVYPVWALVLDIQERSGTVLKPKVVTAILNSQYYSYISII